MKLLIFNCFPSIKTTKMATQPNIKGQLFARGVKSTNLIGS